MAKSTGLSSADERIEGVMMKPAGVINKAAKSNTGKTLGGLAFVIGFLIAVIAGILAGLDASGVNLGIGIAATGFLIGLMALIGLIVGLVNVSEKEAINFLIGAIAIGVASGAMSSLANLGVGFSSVAVFVSVLMQMIGYFVGPAAVIVALKVIYNTARK